MRLRAILASVLLAAATPTLAQEAVRPDLDAAAASFVQPSNAERLRVLTERLTAAGLPWRIETFEGGTPRTGPMAGSNVVVEIGAGDRDLVMTAHYDAVVLDGGALSHGIVDNAGSVLALIEAAERLKDRPLDHRLVVVFFDQEELGLVGAQRWVAAHGTDRLAAVVNVDVAAYGDTVMYGENNGPQSAFVLGALRAQCAERAVRCIGFPVYPPSDDRVFSAAGVPVVSIGTQDAAGAHQMWLAFNGGEDAGLRDGFVPPVFRRIHSDDDTLSWFRAADVARMGGFVADLIVRLDGAASGGPEPRRGVD